MSRLVAAMVVALAIAVAAGSASAAPPITCGRISNGKYVVKSHGASCSFAIRYAKAFMAHRTQPARYKCKRYSADVPAYCIGSGKYKRRYFFASKPS